MSLEQEIDNALLEQSAELMEVIGHCNLILMNSLSDGHPSHIFDTFREARFALGRAEALQAALLRRAGASWDVMSSRGGGIRDSNPVSRQAMHRRLAAEGEYNFQLAQKFPDQARDSLANPVLTVPPTPSKILKFCAARASEIMEAKSIPQWWLDLE